MFSVKTDFSLSAYNTFHIDVVAPKVYFLKDSKELEQIPERTEALILGGGSNVLLLNDLNQPVILNQTKGIEVMHVDDNHVLLTAASGETWHDLVLFAVGQGFGGIENLSLIPGSVGAAPMQNIGAYGVEIKDVLQTVEAIDLKTLELRSFTKEECAFGYRESVFKHALKGRYFIKSIRLKLTTRNHRIETAYGAIQSELSGNADPRPADISEAVMRIRRSKLPDPEVLGNAGSFFKNPVVEQLDFERLKAAHPELRYFEQEDGRYKIPAGWLIESLGWKGRRIGPVGCHAQQALVLVNYGGARGRDVQELSERIAADVMECYGIRLETEVNFIA